MEDIALFAILCLILFIISPWALFGFGVACLIVAFGE